MGTEAAAPLPRLLQSDDVLQLHSSFLVTQDSEGLVVIDQHALHERVMFEKLKHKRGTKEWDYYFLKYMPGKDDYKKKGRKRKTRKKDGSTRKKRRKRRRTRRTRLRKIFGL